MHLRDMQIRLKRAGLTQTAIAARLGVTHGSVSRMLSGKSRMRVETLTMLEHLIAEAESARTPRALGVGETPVQPFQHGPKCLTLEEAKAARNSPRARMTAEEREKWLQEMRELGEAGRRLPRVTDLTHDEILGYDEAP